MTDKTRISSLDNLKVHHKAVSFHDKVAMGIVKFMRFFADAFFAKRYGHRAVVLETIAAVPGMVGGALLHLKSLRQMKDDDGWIRTMLDEAENERMHLMTFVEISRPNAFERFLVVMAQVMFYVAYFILYLVSSRTAHRVVGYLEEEAILSYTQYLQCIDDGLVENVPAPRVAIDYWNMAPDARLRDVVIVVRADEMRHRDVNHCISDKKEGKECTPHSNMSESSRKIIDKYNERKVP